MINPNSAFEEELYFQFLRDPLSVSPEWRKYFEANYPSEKEIFLRKKVDTNEQTDSKKFVTDVNIDSGIKQLNSLQSRIADNMDASLEIPTATSLRNIPVKALDENRRIINKYLLKIKKNKISFTHILSWAIIKCLIKYPNLNDSYQKVNGQPGKIKKNSINLGLAVDIVKPDGTRMLMVPVVRNCQTYSFPEFIQNFDLMISKTRNNKLEIDDLKDATFTLTNPGMIGTTASSPRLMNGQGLIIATGAIEYPPEFQAVRPEMLTKLAVSKTVTITNTYDHRIIQGAESAEFLAYLYNLLIGNEHFYDQIFASLKIPFEPVRWELDNSRINKYGDFDEGELIEKGAHVVQMINAYRVRGHLLASVNPLGFSTYYYPELDPAYYGFTIWDLDRVFHADDNWEKNNLPLRDIIELLRETYCGNFGIEFMHIQDPVKKDWVKKHIERRMPQISYSNIEKKEIFQKLIDAEEFENFLHTKFIGHKRFSLEGSESVVVLLDKLFKLAADSSLNSIVLGMSHRGRLNVLVNIIGKSLDKIFKEFEGDIDPDTYLGSGDVKYHLGDKGIYQSDANNKIPVILAPNPSHLELVDPIIEGMTRALDDLIDDKTYSATLPVLVHGDAAFAGQGIVAETLNFSQLDGYKTGGSVHIIINNQIGFTTNAQDARSTVYATDIAKMIQVPIIHVNGNDPEEVATAARFAFEYRQEFKSDIIIDMLCYRKYGHNEGDEPSYTQPLLYKKIKSMQPVSRIYFDELIRENVLSNNELDESVKKAQDKLYEAFLKRSSENKLNKEVNGKYVVPKLVDIDTSLSAEKLNTIGKAITAIPSDININPKLKQLYSRRLNMLTNIKPDIDWAMAELMAFGSLLAEGHSIRFSGQDSRRGTFSQRHSVITDTETEDQYIPLNNINNSQALIDIYDSPLSELSILGFEYGYSVMAKNSLVIWEAQFGDFGNMAQAMIDQIIVCAELKWQQTSNLTLLLPHSYDGQGPEHSSARLERFLQLAAENNTIVCNLTTPANYYHVLRRQTLNPNKKPLVIMTPKSMLRHPRAVSSLQELSDGKFQKIIPGVIDTKNIKTIVFVTGKIYYELLLAIESENRTDISLNRIEQLYPLDESAIKDIIDSAPNAKHIVWLQEEPQNMGAWNYIAPKLSKYLRNELQLIYIGRSESASTATGSAKKHLEGQTNIINQLLSL